MNRIIYVQEYGFIPCVVIGLIDAPPPLECVCFLQSGAITTVLCSELFSSCDTIVDYMQELPIFADLENIYRKMKNMPNVEIFPGLLRLKSRAYHITAVVEKFKDKNSSLTRLGDVFYTFVVPPKKELTFTAKMMACMAHSAAIMTHIRIFETNLLQEAQTPYAQYIKKRMAEQKLKDSDKFTNLQALDTALTTLQASLEDVPNPFFPKTKKRQNVMQDHSDMPQYKRKPNTIADIATSPPVIVQHTSPADVPTPPLVDPPTSTTSSHTPPLSNPASNSATTTLSEHLLHTTSTSSPTPTLSYSQVPATKNGFPDFRQLADFVDSLHAQLAQVQGELAEEKRKNLKQQHTKIILANEKNNRMAEEINVLRKDKQNLEGAYSR